MQDLKTMPKPSPQAEAITAGLKVAYRKMLAFKKYKGTPVVMECDGKIEYHDPDKVLKQLDKEHNQARK